MKTVDQYLRLFAYDIWANDQVLLTLQKHLDFPESDRAIAYYSHIAASQEHWYRRIKGQASEDMKLWPEYGLPAALQKLKTYAEKWKVLIESNRSDFDRKIHYQNSKGQPYATPLSDILHHIVIHGQHHRAQIAQLLRNAKITPPGTDFIYFSRTN